MDPRAIISLGICSRRGRAGGKVVVGGGVFNLYTQGLFVVVNTRNECKYCQTSDQNVFNSLTQKMNLPFQRPTADSLALSVVCLLTVRVLDISD